MSTAGPAAPSNSFAVTAIGLITMLWGGSYTALGGSLIFGATAMMTKHPGAVDHAGGLADVDHWVASMFAGLATVIGVALLLQGVVGILAGLGVLWRKQWGRIVTFILAVLAILWGLLFMGGAFEGGAFDQSATYIGLGAAQLLYGILAFVILITKGAEFSGRHAEQVVARGPGGGPA
jgi:hypothetical protein